MTHRLHLLLAAVTAVVLAAGCGGSGTGSPPGLVPIVLDKGNPEQLLRYYFGAYAAPGGADPFRAGLVEEEGGIFYVRPDSLEARYPAAAQALTDRDGDGRIGWDEFEAFVDATYYDAVRPPRTLEELQADVPYAAADTGWMRVDVDGVMTNARRRLYVREAAVRHAVREYRSNDRALLYPVGTAIVGEHWMDGRQVETTVMQKRQDGFWNYFVYGEDGRLAASTTTPPRELKAPVQCVGCHFGSKLFEPERSFPAEASPGPHGPRAIYVPDALRDREVTAYFDEHSKRSDDVLGLYGTLFVARLRAERAAGRLPAADARILDALDL